MSSVHARVGRRQAGSTAQVSLQSSVVSSTSAGREHVISGGESVKNGPVNERDISTHHIRAVLGYFRYFSYPVTVDELWYFTPVKSSRSRVQKIVEKLVVEGEVIKIGNRGQYALGGHGISVDARSRGALNSSNIRREGEMFLKFLSYMPWIELVGISGSCAMDNATALDDLDVFIVSAPGRIWLARLTAIISAKVLARHRTYSDVAQNQASHKICLNLFFDALHMTVPKSRQSLYTAHEVVQMRPVVIRGGAYEKFLHANSWVKSYFPNVSFDMQIQNSGRDVRDGMIYEVSDGTSGRWSSIYLPGSLLEKCARWLQLKLMHTPTSETITDEQLWFFPHDFSERLRSKMPL